MSKKQIIILASAGVVVVSLLVGLFVVLPAVQVNAYKQIVGTKQPELNDSLNKLSNVLERDMFVKTDAEPATIHSDVKAGNNAVHDTESKLAAVKSDLTNFAALPLFGFNGAYRTASSLKTDEQAYIQKSEAFIAEMKAVLAYKDKEADLSTKFVEFVQSAVQAGQADSAEEYSTIVDDSIKKLQPTLDELKAMTPPASLKESHDYNIKATDELIGLYKESATAYRAGDMDKMDAISTKLVTLVSEAAKKTSEYNSDFVRTSPLRKLDDARRAMDSDISRKQASL